MTTFPIHNDICFYNTSNETTTEFYNLTSSPDPEVEKLKDAAKWFWKILAPVLVLVGLCGNTGIIVVLVRMKFWKKQIYCFLLILAVINSIVLCVGLTRYWIISMFDIDIRDFTKVGCSIHVFSIYFFMHVSSWTLVSITLDRFVHTKYPFRYLGRYFSRKLALFYLITLLLCLGTDFHFFFTNSLVKIGEKYMCNNTSHQFYVFEEKYYVFIDLAMLSVIPFILMFIMNIFIGKSLQIQMTFRRSSIYNQESRRRINKSSRKLTRMLFYSSSYFLATTLPISVFFAVHSFLSGHASEKQLAELELSKAVIYLIQYTNYSVNFYIYVEFNTTFRKHLTTRRTRFRGQSGSTDHGASGHSHNNTSTDWISDASRSNGGIDNATYTDNKENDSSSNGQIPNQNQSELSASCLTIQDINIRKHSDLSATCQTIAELVDHDFSDLSDTCQTSRDLRMSHVHFSELSDTCTTIPDLPLFSKPNIHETMEVGSSDVFSVTNIVAHSRGVLTGLNTTYKTIEEEKEDDTSLTLSRYHVKDIENEISLVESTYL